MVKDPEKGMTGLGAIEEALFSLFGLLIAFTFSGSASRFDSRRQLLAEEINDIGTAYLRLDLLPAGVQPALHGLFHDYVDSRLAVYRKLPGLRQPKRNLPGPKKFRARFGPAPSPPRLTPAPTQTLPG